MGLNDFILNCERDNKELRKDIEYYKNKNQRLQQENKKLKEKLEASEKARKNCYEYLKNPPEDVWSGHSLEKAKELLDIDKGE